MSAVTSNALVRGADVIAVSAGFDNHAQDWGGLLSTADYRTMGRWVREAALRIMGGATAFWKVSIIMKCWEGTCLHLLKDWIDEFQGWNCRDC